MLAAIDESEEECESGDGPSTSSDVLTTWSEISTFRREEAVKLSRTKVSDHS